MTERVLLSDMMGGILDREKIRSISLAMCSANDTQTVGKLVPNENFRYGSDLGGGSGDNLTRVLSGVYFLNTVYN